MILAYLAAPLTPMIGETIEGNLESAFVWYKALSERFRDRVFVMDWWLHARAFAGVKDDNHELRSLGMLRNFKQITTCQEFWMVGSRLSRGMEAELAHAQKCRLIVKNLIGEK